MGVEHGYAENAEHSGRVKSKHQFKSLQTDGALVS